MKGMIRLKKKILVLSVIILNFILIIGAGCNSQQKEIDNLKIQADSYLAKSDFDNAIELYEKMLTIKESEDIRNSLIEIKYERESVETTKLFLEVIKDVNINYNRPNGLVEVKDVLIRLQGVIENLEKIDTTKETEIAAYIKEVKTLQDYNYLKDSAYNKYFMDAEKSSSIAKIDSGLSILQAGLIGITKSNLKQHTDYILGVKIPERYKDML